MLLVAARAAGFFVRAPGFGRAGVPFALRAGLAFAFALAVAPSQRTLVADAGTLVFLAIEEALIGGMLGIGASLVAEAVAAAGRFIDDTAGIRAAMPSASVAPAGFGTLWSFAFLCAFFSLGGVEAMLAAFERSFEVMPLATLPDRFALQRFAFEYGGSLLRSSLDLSLPAISIVLAIHIAAAGLGRVIPRLANMTLAYPITYGAVVVVALANAFRLGR
jgi:flagellar biosynthesis protein FliR